jgi:arginase
VAAKIARQANKIALLGSPTSAAALSAGHEGAPSALRAAGLADRLRSIGYEVVDMGDDPPRLYQQDEESPRARNLAGVLGAIETLKPRVEEAIKSGALPIILTGDCSMALATVAGARRYFRHVSLIYMDSDADLHTPATTGSGSLDGMVVSHLTGRGAAELVRFWGEPPLVRDPDLALFGTSRIEPAEEIALQRAPLRSYPASTVQRKGAAATAEEAVERIHGNTREFILHFDVDIIAGFDATNFPGSEGLRREEVREALEVFAKQKSLAAIDVAAYNPAKDADGSGAKLIIDLLAGALKARLDFLKLAEAPANETVSAGTSPAAAAPLVGPPATESSSAASVAPGEAWSSDSLDEGSSEAGQADHESATDPASENH